MLKKLIIITSTLIALTCIIVAVSIIFNKPQRIGDLLFAKTIDNLYDIKEIQIEAPDLKITLYNQDNLWRIKEKDGYFAGYLVVDEMFTAFKNSRFYQKITDAKISGINIKTISKNGEVLDDITVDESVAQINDEEAVYLISYSLDLPKDIISWMQQPLTEFDVNNIEKPKVFDTKIKNILSFLYFEDVANSINFEKFNQKKHLEFIENNGLITILDIYTDGEEFWAAKKFDTTKLPKADANNYINANSFLYEGWFFKLPPDNGALLFNF